MDAQLDAAKTSVPPRRLPFWVLLGMLIASFCTMADRLLQVQLRIESLESARLDESLRLQSNVHSQIIDLSDQLEVSSQDSKLAVALQDRLQHTELRLGDIGQSIEAQASKLTDIKLLQESFGPNQLEERFAAFDAASDSRWRSLIEHVATVESSAKEACAAVQRIDAKPVARRDVDRMWNELVGPIVQLTGEVSVGSGVLLRSRRDPLTGSYLTHVLTAWHVVRDIQGDLTKTDMPVPVTIYGADGVNEHVLAELLVFNAGLDAALLEISSEAPFANGASLASRERLSALEIFDQIYAVGCPLGNDPIPTAGEIATVDHHVDGSSYMMINAPTYIGNSGGGIFDATTHQLLGIFSKIYTHGTLRPTIVPHMGLVTPLTYIYAWLEVEGYASVIPEPGAGQLVSK